MENERATEDVEARWAELFEIETLADTRLGMQAAALCFKCKCSHGCKTLITDPELFGAQFWLTSVSVAERGAVREALEQIDGVKRLIGSLRGATELARSAGDVERIAASGKVASIIGLDGADALDGSVGVFRMLAELGSSFVTLAGQDIETHGMDFIEELVREANALGVLLHVAGVSADAVGRFVELSSAPILASVGRDEAFDAGALELIKRSGGLVLAAPLAGPRDVEAIAESVTDLARAVGTESVGLATVGLTEGDEPTSVYPAARRALAERDFKFEDIENIFGGNFVRVWRSGEHADKRE